MSDNVELVKQTMYKYFQFTSCREGQLEASLALLQRKDVMVRMATGSGKSLCMFLAPLTLSDTAIGIIISPLVSLMEQQVSKDIVIMISINNSGKLLVICWNSSHKNLS